MAPIGDDLDHTGNDLKGDPDNGSGCLLVLAIVILGGIWICHHFF